MYHIKRHKQRAQRAQRNDETMNTNNTNNEIDNMIDTMIVERDDELIIVDMIETTFTTHDEHNDDCDTLCDAMLNTL